MRRLLDAWSWLIAGLVITSLLLTSCGSSEYKVFSLKEGIGHFSLEYPPEYSVTRIDIRNDATSRYTDIGLSAPPVVGSRSLNEISIYAWPADGNETAALVLTGMLARAETIFQDFKLLQRSSVMIGDIEGQAATFSWTASPAAASTNESEAGTLPAVSQMVCFRHGELAWEIHVASDLAAQKNAETEFQHILETFQILN
jgi:hypothetical protein